MAGDPLRAFLRHLRRIALAKEGGLTDAQLLERFVSQHDEAAFEVLVWRHGPMVMSLCRRLLRHEQDAEDAFQAGFLVLVRKAGSIGKRAALGSWLYKVAHRLALRARAAAGKRARRERPDLGRLATTPAPDQSWNDLRSVLDEEVSRLPERYRAPFVLCYLEGKTNEEAARQLGCPAGTVMYRLSWARERLRSRLTRRGLALSGGTLAAVLSENVAPAAVPGALINTTIDATMAFAAGNAVAAGVISERVAALTSGVLKTMFLAKLQFVAAVALTASVLSTGAGVLTYRMAGAVAADTGEEPSKRAIAEGVRPPAQGQKSADNAKPDVKPKEAATEPVGKVIESQPKEKQQGERRPLPPRELRAKLAAPINLDRGIEPSTPLADALEYLAGQRDIAILVNWKSFEEDLQIKEIDRQPVMLPRMVGVPLSHVLKMLLIQVNGAYLPRSGVIEVTTPVRAWPEAWADENSFNRHNIPTVDALFTARSLEDTLRELSESSGINVVLDNRLKGEYAQKAITAHLTNVPIDTAVRVVADMADLNVVAMDNVLYVTSKENAAALQAERDKRRAMKPAAGKKEGAGGPS